MEHWKPYAIQEVTDNVRYGKTALRFELRSGSCGKTSKSWDDCKNGPFGSERYELLPNNSDKRIGFNGNVWHTISWYIEKFHTPFDGHNSIWQIHNDGDWAPMFNTTVNTRWSLLQNVQHVMFLKFIKNIIVKAMMVAQLNGKKMLM